LAQFVIQRIPVRIRCPAGDGQVFLVAQHNGRDAGKSGGTVAVGSVRRNTYRKRVPPLAGILEVVDGRVSAAPLVAQNIAVGARGQYDHLHVVGIFRANIGGCA
jgi:hypothetical protein